MKNPCSQNELKLYLRVVADLFDFFPPLVFCISTSFPARSTVISDPRVERLLPNQVFHEHLSRRSLFRSQETKLHIKTPLNNHFKRSKILPLCWHSPLKNQTHFSLKSSLEWEVGLDFIPVGAELCLQSNWKIYKMIHFLPLGPG